MERGYGLSNTSYSAEWERSWQKTKRIAASKYFPYYFQLTVPDTDVSQSELDYALNKSTSVDAFVGILRHFKASKRVAPFIDKLRDHLGSLPGGELLIFLESIFVVGDEVEIQGAPLFGVFSEYLRFAMWFLLDILDLLPSSNRFEMLCQVMRGRPAVFTISDVTAMCERIVSGESDSLSLKLKYQDLTVEIVSEMKVIAVDAIERAAQEGRLQSVPQLGAVLYRWRQWADPKRVSEWASSTFLNSPKGAVSFIAAFARSVSKMSVRDKVPKVLINIPMNAIAEFADLNLVADLVRNTHDEELTDKEREAKTRFLSAKARLDSGQNPDDRFVWDDDESE